MTEGRKSTTAKNAKGSSTGIIWFAGTITALWLAGSALYVIGKRFGGLCDGYPLYCVKAGDLGSFLSGIFAPVAFFWVAAAVWIQSLELREQREELRLTRGEYEQSRRVMEAQVEEARKQAELLRVQTQLLVNANNEAETLAKFQAHVSLLATRLRQYQNGWTFDAGDVVVNPDGMGANPLPQIALRDRDINDDGDQTLIASTTNAIRTKTRYYRFDHPDVRLSAKYPYDFMRIFGAMDGCRREAKTLPEPRAVLAEALELKELGDIMDWLKGRIGNLPPERH